MALKTLYHGTDVESARDICEKIDVKIGARNSDFGQGFYTTDSFDMAAKWAYRKARFRNSKLAVVKLFFDEDSAKPIMEVFDDDIRWGRFIINNRNGASYIRNVMYKENNLDSHFEITCGRIADFEIIRIANELNSSGQMLDSIDKILNTRYPIQIAFHTRRATEYIKKTSYQILQGGF